MGRVGKIVKGLLCVVLLNLSVYGVVGTRPVALDTALSRQDAWLATSPEGSDWNKFLMTNELRQQLQRPTAPNRRVLASVLSRYESETPGLEHPRFKTTRVALKRFADQQRVPLAVRWSEQLRAQADAPAAIDDAVVARARARLVAARNDLDRYLSTADPATRDGWKKFLKWEDLDAELAAGTPNWESLSKVVYQFWNGHPGLEYPQFARVREALRTYVYLGSSNGNGQKNMAIHLNSLADKLDAYNTDPSTKNAGDVAFQLDLLNQFERVPGLASDMRKAHLMPNVKLRISENLLTRRFSQSVNEPMAVNEVILGTRVSGNAITTGSITTDIVADPRVARVDIVFRGNTRARTVGRQKPVTIQSTSVTALEARKPLYIHPDHVTSMPTKAAGNTQTTIHSITPDRRLGRRLINKVAWKRAGQQKPQSERIASERAARRVEQQMDEQSQELLTRAQSALREQLNGPISHRGLLPEKLHTSSLDHCALVMATQADPSQFSATTQPPDFCPHDDVVAQVHESAFNNTAEKAIAGLTLTDERIAELTKEITGSVPEELQPKDDEDPWSISFDWQQPVTVEFNDETLKITIRGRQFTSGEKTLRKTMEMSATYRFRTTPTGVNLTRQGDIDVTFPKNKNGRVGMQDRIFRTLMEKKFAEVFKPEIQGEGFMLPGRFEALGTIRLNDLSSDNGWLSLGWK